MVIHFGFDAPEAAAERVYAVVQGHVVLEAPTSESNLPQRLERVYFGHESHVLDHRPAAS